MSSKTDASTKTSMVLDSTTLERADVLVEMTGESRAAIIRQALRIGLVELPKQLELRVSWLEQGPSASDLAKDISSALRGFLAWAETEENANK